MKIKNWLFLGLIIAFINFNQLISNSCPLGYQPEGKSDLLPYTEGDPGPIPKTNVNSTVAETYFFDKNGNRISGLTPQGLIDINAIRCRPCTPGTYDRGDNTCVLCPKYTISGVASSKCTSCNPLPPYTQEFFNPSMRQIDWWNNTAVCLTCSSVNNCTCPSGTISTNISNLPTCLPCGPGKISTSQTACQQCQAGTYVDLDKNTCSPCAQGTFSAIDNSTCLSKCPAGQYQNGNICAKCPVGLYSNVGATTCTKCQPGYVTNADQTACTICPAGTYQIGNSCQSCPANNYCLGGANIPQICPAGTGNAGGGTSQTSCTPCPAGQYGTSPGSGCQPCPKAYYSTNTGSTQCTSCTPGTTTTAPGASSASQCNINVPRGTYGTTGTTI